MVVIYLEIVTLVKFEDRLQQFAFNVVQCMARVVINNDTFDFSKLSLPIVLISTIL